MARRPIGEKTQLVKELLELFELIRDEIIISQLMYDCEGIEVYKGLSRLKKILKNARKSYGQVQKLRLR